MNITTQHIQQALDHAQEVRHHVTFRFNKDAIDTLDSCAVVLSEACNKKPSKPLAIRFIIDMHADLYTKNIPIPVSDMLTVSNDIKQWLTQETIAQVSLTLTETQRVTLRKLEFELQSTDWNTLIERNDAVQILLMSYGQRILKADQPQIS